jgi:hypothetical protein
MSNKEPMPYTKAVVSVLSCAFLLSSASADDWPQWQGPDQNAISKEGGLLKEWPKEGPPLAWKIKELGGGLVTLSKDANGGVKAEEVYFSKKMQNHHGGMIVFDGCLYGANGGNEGGALVCLDFKTGNVLWDEHDDAEHRAPKGSVALADGRIYYRTEKGAMLLLEPNRKQYIKRGRFDQPDRSQQPAWTHPVIANGKLYLRDQDVLFCYDVKAK